MRWYKWLLFGIVIMGIIITDFIMLLPVFLKEVYDDCVVYKEKIRLY